MQASINESASRTKSSNEYQSAWIDIWHTLTDIVCNF